MNLSKKENLFLNIFGGRISLKDRQPPTTPSSLDFTVSVTYIIIQTRIHTYIHECAFILRVYISFCFNRYISSLATNFIN